MTSVLCLTMFGRLFLSDATPILKSKLRPPRIVEIIRHDRYRTLAGEILSKQLTTVVAGAGYGKTTMIAQAMDRLDCRRLWYRLDSADDSLSTFCSYLSKGIQEQLPDFADTKVIDPPDGGHTEAGVDAKMQRLLAELENDLDGDLIIILDNFHLVQDSADIREALKFILKYVTASVHLVLISRLSIRLPLSRLKAQRQLLEITQDDLIFSREETVRLCGEIFQVQWDPDILDALYDLTRGWVSGLTLFFHELRNFKTDSVRDFLKQQQALPEAVADYIEEEVFSPLESGIKDFLLRTSLLFCIKSSFCDEWLGISQSHQTLEYLKNHHLFTRTIRDSEGGYVYHNLLRTFLQKKLAVLFTDESIAGLHRDAARLCEKREEIVEALTHYQAVGDYGDVCRLLNQFGRDLFQKGKYDILKQCLEQTPHEYMDEYPWVRCLQGKLRGIFGHPMAASRSYRHALAIFEERNETDGVNLIQIELALNCYLSGEFLKAARVLENLLLKKSISNDLRIEALGYLFYISAYMQHRDTWKHFRETATNIYNSLDNSELSNMQKAWLDVYRGYACHATGDSQTALEIGRSVEWMNQQLDSKKRYNGHYGLMACACAFRQRFEEGLEWARKGIALLSKEGHEEVGTVSIWQPARATPGGVRDRGAQDTTLPFLLVQAANNAFGLGRANDAIGYAKHSAAIFRTMGARWAQAWALNVLSTAYALKGDLVLAEQSALAGMGLIKGLDLPRLNGTLKGNLAVFLVLSERNQQALPLIREAQKDFATTELSYWIDLWLAMYYWQEDRKKAIQKFKNTLAFCEKNREYRIVAEKHWIVPFLVDAYARGHFREYIIKALRKIGTDATRELRALLRQSRNTSIRSAASILLRELPKQAPPGLKIQLLGCFQVCVGNWKVPAGKWGNQKVRSLFQYMAQCRPNGYVNRDVLIEMLWPDQDPVKTKNRFHVTMTTMRRVLEPDLPDGAPSSYISRVGDTYRIDLGQGGQVDTHHFSDLVTRAKEEKAPCRRAINNSIEAVSAYTGDMLAEDLFCSWCSEIRDNLKRDYLDTLESIFTYFENCGDWDQCMLYAEKYLAADRAAEKIYRILMRCYAATGNPTMVASTLKRCKENLLVELDCRVETETETLARQLMSETTHGRHQN